MDNTAPFFSIVIPTYNHAHFMKRCLDGLINQTYDNWEAIVINNFSEDNTIEIVEGYNDPRIRLINNANGGIIAVSRNKGISEAKGDWICFLDSDDWWYPNKLEFSLPYLNNYDLIFHDLVIHNKFRKPSGVVKGRILKGNIANDLLINCNGIANSSVIVRKSIVDTTGFLVEDKSLVAVEDFDYWIRIAQITSKFKYLNESLGAYWIGGNISVSEKQIDREYAIFDKYKNLLNKRELDFARKSFAFRRAWIFNQLDLFERSRKEYLVSLSHPFLLIKIKSIVGLLVSIFKIKL